MTNTITALALTLALVGCSKYDVGSLAIARAAELCAPHGGAASVGQTAYRGGILVHARCQNGAEIDHHYESAQ